MENAPPLRVMHLDLGMEYRGGQRQVLYLAGEQLRQGYDVRVAAPAGAPVLLEVKFISHYFMIFRFYITKSIFNC